ncbi:MAG: bifunctional folylpolyglutamate synthase/dihydrofolate synthase [Muribaculaceae bacterium]|nr:bifunctional folylpolyglutamate synthase/dihydrofolate synthase [Muribaculaceae bacterium]
MTYSETIDWLFSQTAVFERDGASAYKPGLETISRLCALFGDPQRRLRCVHVAGTNGKGSTASTLAAILQAAGLKVGLYTSPHLVDFRERIRVDGQMIPQQAVVDFVERWRQLNSELHPSFFELTTALAFEWFAMQGTDIAIIEVGLGGRLDSTNVITPLVSVITNISLDHTGLLGDTPAAIAAEKAGIIKPGVPVVVGYAPDPDVRAVFTRKAAEVGSPIEFVEPIEARELPDGTWLYPALNIHGALRGTFQPRNAATVLATLHHLPPVSADAIRRGFEQVEELTGLRGRMTLLESAPQRILYDTGHNPGAWEYLADELRRMARPLAIICGFAADKDVDAILAKMPADADYIFCAPTTNRALPAADLQAMAKARGLRGETAETVAEALDRARRLPVNTIFIGGSNYLVGDLLKSNT